MLTAGFTKSTYSNSFSNCLEARWRKSTHSTHNGQCAEVRAAGGLVQVRDSKLGRRSPRLSFTPAAWQAFLNGIKAG